ncbi:ECF RNA polymerase sigma factor SigE [Gemmata obscuriglobus]|uniref:Uncharacterized protein n=1 Tax=Gemmata obscuriglobus TaxID=114 RepID=A0A2Z3H528_9BACT|nr:sigma-70 family RNA polymerase sigma factor [Gemmata obscuriglobus]AWM38225.1 hypothetical protein C1280_15340 [Gemmata obscuriglobus]QEG28872.1 ECF RNA polymerase sigma factor SigE [Gemmata obscuriglobus]VTS07315.1 wd-40 repeat-containing protein : Uncultured bacterium genome assembly Metasoil_fosmids_resub OS=uncultured bacterium PE=4 SV=1: Sigma70_r2: Sigma70_r4_2: WD40: WD40: WD40: WD40: WD40: WD40: WD40 [Gemmata obscuriglobus UQM 2246]
MPITRNILAALHAPGPDTGATDAELLGRFADTRDEAAFEALVRRHARLVWGVCCRALGHAQDTEDAFQATFLVLARNPHKPRRAGTASGFLFGVARRVALKMRAQTAARAARPPAPEPGAGADPSAEAALHELQAALDDEVGRLPEVYRVAFLLCVVEGLSRADAAAELGVAPGTLSGRLARARLLLRARLAKRGVQLAAALALNDLAASAAPPAAVRAAVAVGAARQVKPVLAVVADVLRARTVLGAALGLVACVVVAAGLATGDPPRPADVPAPRSAEKSVERPAARDVRGDPLPVGAVARLGSARWRHEGEAESLAFAPDGKTLAVLSLNDHSISLFETTTGKTVHRIAFPDGTFDPSVVAFSPDGLLFACRGGDGTVYLWDAQSRKLVHTLKSVGGEGPGRWSPVVFSPNGKFLAASAGPNLIAIWDAVKGKHAVTVTGHQHANPSMAFSRDGRHLAVATQNPVVQLFDAATGKRAGGFDPGQRFALCLAFSPDGKVIATGGKDMIVLSDAVTGKELGRMEMKQVLNVAFAPDGKALVSVGEDCKVRVWDVATKRERRVLDGRGWLGRSMALSADGKTVALGSVHNVVRVWDLDTGRELSEQADGHDAPVRAVAFSPDGRTLVTGGENQQIRVWDAARLRPVGQLKGYSAQHVAFSPDSSRLLTAWDWSKSARVWDINRGNKLLDFGPVEGERLPAAAFAREGKTVVTVSWRWNGEKPVPNAPRTIGLFGTWDAATGKRIREASLPGVGNTVLALSPDGRLAAVGGQGEAPLWLCDIARGHERRLSYTPWDTVKGVAFSPDGRLLATGGIDREHVVGGGTHHRPRIWEVSTGREVLQLAGHERTVTALAFAPGGRVLATADGDDNLPSLPPGPQTIRFWDVGSGKELARLGGHHSNVTSLAFSKDGTQLVAGMSNGTALVWEAPAAIKPVPSKPGRKLGPKELAALWNDLSGSDARVAHEAVRILAGSPEQSVPFLADALKPAGKLDAAQVRKWIADLKDDTFAVREAASRELAARGEDVEPDLEKALADVSPEAVRRVQALLTALRNSPPPDRRRELRGMWVLELIGTPAAQKVLTSISQGDPGARLTREAKAALARR